jgi:pimeloyl-ACP methyl ester carboxylesterase
MCIHLSRTLTRVPPIAAAAMAMLTSACTTLTGEEATTATLKQATQSGFSAQLVEGNGYSHDVLLRGRADSDLVWVFIEGDGLPWTDAGTRVANNPTARNPLALRLALQTPGTVIYLGRPCYLRSHTDARCTSKTWTSSRYSNEVVLSMTAALQTVLKQSDFQRIVLVGYSGGGTLAVLMAQSLSSVTAVVTIAGNLDTAEWTRQHGYEPLTGRNPAEEPALPSSIAQLHLIGGKDENVTEAMSARYFARESSEQIWRHEKFGHVCCWGQTWPEIVDKVSAMLKMR